MTPNIIESNPEMQRLEYCSHQSVTTDWLIFIFYESRFLIEFQVNISFFLIVALQSTGINTDLLSNIGWDGTF